MTTSEIKFVVLGAIIMLLAVGIIFDPFETVSYSHRTAGALVIGPLSLVYGLVGLIRGRFPEMVDATRDGSKWKYWFCTTTFLVTGIGGTLLGLDATGILGS
ncbi:MAG: hypothetical protein AABZ45_08890 [Pseudomonadota bacterium]